MMTLNFRSNLRTGTGFSMGVLALVCLFTASLQAAEFAGGFLERPATATPRALMTQSQIQSLLPQRGGFTFPAPYHTSGVRLTNSSDCGGDDCVNYLGYSYWRNMNNHVGQESMLILVGMYRSRGGAGPSLLSYNKITDEVLNLGPLFEDSDAMSWATGEGWYFSANEPYTIYMNNDSRLLRYDVITRQSKTVFDLNSLLGTGYYLWQVHSSANDRVHSATVRDSATYAMLGCMVYLEETGQYHYYLSQGDFDECQIDKSGNWLLIKENLDGRDGEDNRIINISTGQERILLDYEGAAGHSDMGFGYMIAADNFANDANTQKVWDFNADILEGLSVYHNANWDVAAPAHVSHSNAIPETPSGSQFACGSSANRINRAQANEVICFRLNGSDEALVVAPVMTDLNATGGGDDYAKSPKGNLDVTGKYFIWTSNMGGSRLDAFLVKVPGDLLSGATTDPGDDPLPTPAPPPPAPPAPATALTWTGLVNAAVSGTTLSKTGGCDGCSDAGAVSEQEIISGDGSFEFAVDETQKLRYIGLSVNQQGTDPTQINFALALQAGYAEVRENGAYRSDTPINPGDVLQILVQAGQVSYARNGIVFYTSSAAPAYPLRAYATLFSLGSTVSDARLAAGTASGGDGPPADDGGGSETLTAAEVHWQSLVHAVVKGTTLIKRGGCNGCSDAGAVSAQSIVAGKNGYLEFTVDETQKHRYAGLSVTQVGTSAGQIEFALALQTGYVEVREKGAYRADIAINRGDVLRISVAQGVVNYAHNGEVFYTSGVASTKTLNGTASLLSRGSTVNNAVIATSN
jgi:hypothetical protein